MALNLLDMPPEILLHLAAFLQVEELLSLLRTCSALHALGNDRSVWISVLDAIRLSFPLPCPPHTDLTRPRYTLERLRALALHKLRLDARWTHPIITPKPDKPPLVSTFDEVLDIIFSVQGTDILLLNFPEREEVVCWDKQAGTSFRFPPIRTGGRVIDVAAPCDADGVSTVAFLTRPNPNSVPFTRCAHVVKVFHDDQKATGLEHQKIPIDAAGAHFESIFVSEDIVGWAVADDIDDHLTLTVASRVAGARLSEETSRAVAFHRQLDEDDMTLCFVYQGHVYNLLENGITAQIQHFSRNTVLSGEFEETGIWRCDVPSWTTTTETEELHGPFCFMLPSTPFYGVGAVFVRWLGVGVEDSIVTIGFLPCSLTGLADDGNNSPLSFPSPCVTASTTGRPARAMPLVWMDHGGFNVTIMVEEPDGFKLMLVRYHPWAADPTSVHTLELPTSVDAKLITTVCVDETAGTVHLVDENHVLTTLYYT
ncbi:F-box domain-containing protein [Mycena chlorophos]|uniref:F-box domain-containing protein n=1 Tax=Mycena chlorophos TaxID=658473 RepID=A0A8H6RZD8_MYCCL|nr:F-box domain-containing protein [Mycena chlorophos]